MNSQHSQLLFHTLLFEYVPFIVLLASLYIITGGLHLDSNITSRPETNTFLLALGGVFASVLGTTGASMLLILPLMKILKKREYKIHTLLFLIAIVGNTGGLLTPIGDPPLFMLYLKGTPFFWFLNLFPEWLFTNTLLLIIYFLTDRYYFSKEEAEIFHPTFKDFKLKITGKFNFIFLVIVLISVMIFTPDVFKNVNSETISLIRTFILILVSLMSILFTDKKIHKSNQFSWHPLEEVTYLFLGIFITMIPCLLYLEKNAEHLAKNSPMFFYYISGILSSFLDNTPTAVTMHTLAKGLTVIANTSPTNDLVSGIPVSLLKSISIGSVYWGAMTYIGNGPNFMIKAIAEHNGVKMPHFFEYILKFSLIILLPIYILVQLLFI